MAEETGALVHNVTKLCQCCQRYEIMKNYYWENWEFWVKQVLVSVLCTKY
jgi:hypothetical protein